MLQVGHGFEKNPGDVGVAFETFKPNPQVLVCPHSNDLPTETGTLLDLVSKQSKVVEVGGTTAKRLVLELRSVVRLEGQLASDGK